MRSRHRSPNDGGRMASHRNSPEGLIRKHGMYNPEFRKFNKRGFRKGPRKPYPPLPPRSPDKGDIFMKAGRLAAEYLVSKGLLSPDSLIGKQQDGNFKGQFGDMQEFRAQDGPIPSSEGRTSALSRLGNAVPESTSHRKRNFDDFNPVGSRNHGRGRRSLENYKGYGSDWSRETKRNVPFDAKDETFGGNHKERRVDSDVTGRVTKLMTNEVSSGKESSSNSKSKLENFDIPDESGPMEISSDANGNLPDETLEKPNKELADAEGPAMETGQVEIDSICDERIETQNMMGDLGKQDYPTENNDILKKHGDDSVDLSSIVKTVEMRSSLEVNVSNVDPHPSTEDSNVSDVSVAKPPKLATEEDSIQGTSSIFLTNPSDRLKSLETNSSQFPPFNSAIKAQDLDSAIGMKNEICQQPQLFLDKSLFIHEQESSGPLGFERSRSAIESKESCAQHPHNSEGTKKPRDWSSPSASQDQDDLIILEHSKGTCEETKGLSVWPPSNVPQHDNDLIVLEDSGAPSCLQNEKPPREESIKANDRERVVEGSLSVNGKSEICLEYKQDDQHSLPLFKTCDLNLTDVTDIAESPGAIVQGHTINNASALGVDKQVSEDEAFSFCRNNLSNIHKYDESSSANKGIVGIHSANDYVIEDKVFGTSGQKMEPMFASSDSFVNHSGNSVDLHGANDRYGLNISELLGTDLSSCSSVLSANVNDLNTGMSLHGQEVMPCEDSFYASFDELQMGLLSWDQPSQDYGKPF